jgi:hypothetical protein
MEWNLLFRRAMPLTAPLHGRRSSSSAAGKLARIIERYSPGRSTRLRARLPGLIERAGGWTGLLCWAGVVWAITLLVRAHLVFMRPSVGLGVDESYVTALAQRMIDGRMLPYVDGVSHRGPVLYWAAALFVLAGGWGWAGMRMLGLLASVACSLFSFLAGRRAGYPLAGAIAAWATPLATLVVIAFPSDGIGVTGEGLANVFVMAGLFAIARGLGDRAAAPSAGWVSGAGALFMLGALTKQSEAGQLLPPALWVVTAAVSRPGLTRARRWHLAGAFLAGAAAPVLAVLLRYAAAGELRTFWYYYVEYNVRVYMAPFAQVDRLEELRRWFSANALVLTLAALGLAGGIARVALAVRTERSLWRGIDRAGFVLVVALGAACSVLGAKAPLRDWAHYFLQVVPWFGLLLGLMFSPPAPEPEARPSPVLAAALLLPLGLLCELGWGTHAAEHRARTLAFRPPAVCRLVQEHSRPGDRMLVWGFWPAFYVDCDRKPASRFVYTTIPAGVVPWFLDVPKSRDDQLAAPGSREALLHDLEESQAALVLDHWYVDRPIRRYEALARYLDQHYYFVGASDGTRVYRRGKRDARMLFDFEGRSLAGWQLEGDAFVDSPKVGAELGQAFLTGQEGRWLLNSFTRARRDSATGSALSPPFALDRERLGLLVGGGVGCRIEIRIEGGPVWQSAQGPTAAEHLFEVNWDVRAHRGKRARLAIFDESEAPWGHCLIDRVELFDVSERVQ